MEGARDPSALPSLEIRIVTSRSLAGMAGAGLVAAFLQRLSRDRRQRPGGPELLAASGDPWSRSDACAASEVG